MDWLLALACRFRWIYRIRHSRRCIIIENRSMQSCTSSGRWPLVWPFIPMLFAAAVVLEDVFVARQQRCLRYLHQQLLPIIVVAIAELGSPVEQQLLQDDRRRRPPSSSRRPPPRCSRLDPEGHPNHRRRSRVVSDGSIRRSRRCIINRKCARGVEGCRWSSAAIVVPVYYLVWSQRHGDTWYMVVTAHNDQVPRIDCMAVVTKSQLLG